MVSIVDPNMNEKINNILKEINIKNSNNDEIHFTDIFVNNLRLAVLLYLTDPYRNYNVKKTTQEIINMFKKYKIYVESDYYRFKYDISKNERHFLTETSIDEINQFLCPKTITYDVIITEDTYENIKHFLINDIKHTKTIEEFNRININTSVFDIYSEQNLLKNASFTKETNENILSCQNANIIKVIHKLNNVYDNLQTMHRLMETMRYEKIRETKTNLEKEHCKRTIELDTHKLKEKLNTDIIKHIQTFIEVPFLEKIRKKSIQDKYFKNKNIKHEIKGLLKKFTLKQLQHYCNNNIYLLYDLSILCDSSDFINIIFNNQDIVLINKYHYYCNNQILLIKKKKTLIHKIMNNDFLLHYYDFQRDLLILNKILL